MNRSLWDHTAIREEESGGRKGGRVLFVWSLNFFKTVASVYCGIGDVQDILTLMLGAFLFCFLLIC